MSGSEELVSFSSLFNYSTYRELSNMSKEIDVKTFNYEIDRLIVYPKTKTYEIF